MFTATVLAPKDMTHWNLALARAQRKQSALAQARGAVSGTLHAPREPAALGAGALGADSNLADAMRPESTVLAAAYGLASDFEYAPWQRDNTVMQICAWDEAVPDSAVSGCVNMRSTFNLNTELEGRTLCTPFSVFALSKPRFETLRAAVREQPTLVGMLEAVCDVFEHHDDVDFAFDFADAQKPSDARFALRAADAPRSVMQAVNVNASAYAARRKAGGLRAARDLRIKRVEVAFHEDVRSRCFIAESLRVEDAATGVAACFVMSNFVPSGPATPVPRTAVHLFGAGCTLAGGSVNNLLGRHAALAALPPAGGALAHALAALRSLRGAAERGGNVAARAFEPLREDPYLARARVLSTQAHPGLRLVVLEAAGGPLDPPRRVCVVLTAVMDCQDARAALAGAEAAALGARAVALAGPARLSAVLAGAETPPGSAVDTGGVLAGVNAPPGAAKDAEDVLADIQRTVHQVQNKVESLGRHEQKDRNKLSRIENTVQTAQKREKAHNKKMDDVLQKEKEGVKGVKKTMEKILDSEKKKNKGINEIKDAVHGVRQKMKKESAGINKIKDAVHGVQQRMKKENENVNEIKDAVHGVRQKMKKENAGINEIKDAVHGVRQKMKKESAGINEIKDAVHGVQNHEDKTSEKAAETENIARDTRKDRSDSSKETREDNDENQTAHRTEREEHAHRASSEPAAAHSTHPHAAAAAAHAPPAAHAQQPATDPPAAHAEAHVPDRPVGSLAAVPSVMGFFGGRFAQTHAAAQLLQQVVRAK